MALKPILRKGNFSGQPELSGQKDLVVNLTIKGQGVKSPATQLAEQLGPKSSGTELFRHGLEVLSHITQTRDEDIRQALLEHIDSSVRPYFCHQSPQG